MINSESHPLIRHYAAQYRIDHYLAKGRGNAKWYDTAATVVSVVTSLGLCALTAYVMFGTNMSIWMPLGVSLGVGIISSLISGVLKFKAIMIREQQAEDALYLNMINSQEPPHHVSDLPAVDKRVYHHLRNSSELEQKHPESPMDAKRRLDALGIDYTNEARYRIAANASHIQFKIDPLRTHQQALQAATAEQRPQIVAKLKTLSDHAAHCDSLEDLKAKYEVVIGQTDDPKLRAPLETELKRINLLIKHHARRSYAQAAAAAPHALQETFNFANAFQEREFACMLQLIQIRERETGKRNESGRARLAELKGIQIVDPRIPPDEARDRYMNFIQQNSQFIQDLANGLNLTINPADSILKDMPSILQRLMYYKIYDDSLSAVFDCLLQQHTVLTDDCKSQQDFLMRCTKRDAPEKVRSNLLKMIDANQHRIDALEAHQKESYKITLVQLERIRLQLSPDEGVRQTCEITHYMMQQDKEISKLRLYLEEHTYPEVGAEIASLQAEAGAAVSIKAKSDLLSKMRKILAQSPDKKAEALMEGVRVLEIQAILRHFENFKTNQAFRTNLMTQLQASHPYIMNPILRGYDLTKLSELEFISLFDRIPAQCVRLSVVETIVHEFDPEAPLYSADIKALEDNRLTLLSQGKFGENFARIEHLISTQKQSWMTRFGRSFVDSFKPYPRELFVHDTSDKVQNRLQALIQHHDKKLYRTRMFTIIATDLIATQALIWPLIFIHNPFLFVGSSIGISLLGIASHYIGKSIQRREQAISRLLYTEYLRHHKLRSTPSVDLKGRVAKLGLDGYETTGARLALGEKPLFESKDLRHKLESEKKTWSDWLEMPERQATLREFEAKRVSAAKSNTPPF